MGSDRRCGLRFGVGVDIGGTKIAAAVVDDDGRIYERVKVRTGGGGW
jgi:predicted NBD/HSP70 family sugar kinase